MPTEGPVIWQETMKNVQNEKNTHNWSWNMVRKPKNVENETHTHQDLEYGEKTEKLGK